MITETCVFPNLQPLSSPLLSKSPKSRKEFERWKPGYLLEDIVFVKISNVGFVFKIMREPSGSLLCWNRLLEPRERFILSQSFRRVTEPRLYEQGARSSGTCEMQCNAGGTALALSYRHCN